MIVHRHDAIARTDAGRSGRRIRLHGADDGGLILVHRHFGAVIQHGRGEPGAPGRQDGRPALAEQVDDLGEGKHTVGGDVVDPGDVREHGVPEGGHDVVLVDELVAGVEAQDRWDDRQREQRGVRGADVRPKHVREPHDRGGDVGALLGEVADSRLGLDDVALDPRGGRVRAAHGLREEGRVVLGRAVVVRRGLEDEAAHARAAARGQDVHRPDHVVLVRLARAGGDRVDHQAAVHDCVDLGGLDDPPE